MTLFDREICARTVWMEARGEGHEGMRAVAHVLHNRLRARRWSFNGLTTMALVCLADRQFSCWNADRGDANREAMAVLDDEDGALRQAREIVDRVLAGDADPTNGATHYYSRSLVTPPDWSAGKAPCAAIGRHVFFKGVA